MKLREQLRELVATADNLQKAREAEALRLKQEQDERDRQEGYRYAQQSLDWVISVVKDVAAQGKFHYDWPLERTGLATLTPYARGQSQAIIEFMNEQDIGANVGYTTDNNSDRNKYDHYVRIFWM